MMMVVWQRGGAREGEVTEAVEGLRKSGGKEREFWLGFVSAKS
jgi:hypothetical protein